MPLKPKHSVNQTQYQQFEFSTTETTTPKARNNILVQDVTPAMLRSVRDLNVMKQSSGSQTTGNSTQKTAEHKDSAAKKRKECCPCLLENLESTTSLLLEIYNGSLGDNARDNSSDNPQGQKGKSKSKRSVKQEMKRTKKRRVKGTKRRQRQDRIRKKSKKVEKEVNILSQLDICCLCSILPEEELALLGLDGVKGSSNPNVKSVLSSVSESTTVADELSSSFEELSPVVTPTIDVTDDHASNTMAMPITTATTATTTTTTKKKKKKF